MRKPGAFPIHRARGENKPGAAMHQINIAAVTAKAATPAQINTVSPIIAVLSEGCADPAGRIAEEFVCLADSCFIVAANGK